MATHSSILAWEIPRRGEPGRLQPMGSQELDMTQRLKPTTRVGHDLVTKTNQPVIYTSYLVRNPELKSENLQSFSCVLAEKNFLCMIEDGLYYFYQKINLIIKENAHHCPDTYFRFFFDSGAYSNIFEHLKDLNNLWEWLLKLNPVFYQSSRF